jgi:hypothetical protein
MHIGLQSPKALAKSGRSLTSGLPSVLWSTREWRWKMKKQQVGLFDKWRGTSRDFARCLPKISTQAVPQSRVPEVPMARPPRVPHHPVGPNRLSKILQSPDKPQINPRKELHDDYLA